MVKLRKFKIEDAYEVASLIKNALLKVSAQYYPKRIIKNLIKDYNATSIKTRNNKRDIFVATIKNKIVGTIQFTNDGWVCGLFVHNNYQNLGIGTKLVAKIKQVAKNNGFDAIRSHIAINSIGFYKKLGFSVVKKVIFKTAGETYRVILRL